MRHKFPQRRRVAGPSGPDAKKEFLFEAPPELPRTIEPSAFKKYLPMCSVW